MTADPARSMQALTEEQRHLVELHIGVVASVLSRFRRRGSVVPLDELEAVANGALVDAAPSYDPSRGPFDRYAFVRVRGAVLNCIDAAHTSKKRECNFSSLSPSSDLPEVSLDDFLGTTVNDEQAAVIGTVELGIVGGIMGYFGSRAATPEDQVSQHQEQARTSATLERFIASLRHPQSLIYQRFYRENRPAEAIAAELGVSARTVERTLRTLREQVNIAFIESGLIAA